MIVDNLIYVSKQIDMSFNDICKLNYIQLYKLYLILKKEYDMEINRNKLINKKNFDHGYHVIQKLNTHEKIDEFVKMWRTHFIETMKPKYMPEGWSVDFRIKVDV